MEDLLRLFFCIATLYMLCNFGGLLYDATYFINSNLYVLNVNKYVFKFLYSLHSLEVVVEPWIENLFPALRKHLGRSEPSTPLDKSTLVDQILTCNGDSSGDKTLLNSQIAPGDEHTKQDKMTANLKSSVPPLSTAGKILCT